MNKNKLIDNFSKNAETYEQYASVQKRCAKRLLSLIPDSQYLNILEIGSGTGVYTNLLSQKFPKAAITGIDISDNMIDIARRRVKNDNIEFIKVCIQEMSCQNKFNIITSNVTLHWVPDLENAFHNISQHLTDKGYVAVSMYGPGTFSELKSVLSALYGKNKWLSSSSFHDKDKILNVLSDRFDSLEIYEENIQVVYPDIWTFFYSIKRTGTQGEGISKYIQLTKNRILEIENKYLDIFDEIKATHNVYFCRGIKK